jgi:cytochrome c
MAAFFIFVLLGIHAPGRHAMPHTQSSGQARSTANSIVLHPSIVMTHLKLHLAAGLAVLSWSAVAAGEADAGRTLYQARCAGCHSLDYNGVGPAHRGVFGRAAAQARGFAYSDALKSSSQVWNEDSLDRWLADPEKFAPGQRMGFSVPDAKDRSDLIAFLKQATKAVK